MGKPTESITEADILRSLVAAGPNELWVETWDRDDGGSWWLVMDASNQLVSRVQAPPDTKLIAIGADWVLGLWRDTFGVEQVRLYSLIRN